MKMEASFILQVRRALVRLGLAEYADEFVSQGWDDLGYLLTLDKSKLADVAKDVGMKPGHAAKFIDLLPDSAR